MQRILDGEYLGLNQKDVDVLIGEYDADCELLDCVCPTFERWLAAKLWDTRNTLISYGIRG